MDLQESVIENCYYNLTYFFRSSIMVNSRTLKRDIDIPVNQFTLFTQITPLL